MALLISATVLTRNSARRLDKCLASLANFDEVVVLDSGSSDATESICARYPNVRFESHDFAGFGAQHNYAIQLCRNDWIFSLDSDEELSSPLPTTLDPIKAYSFPRKNFYRGQWIKGCGWSPDRVIRLFHKGHARFSDDPVHERVLAQEVIDLPTAIIHEPYTCIADFLTKMQLYSDLFQTTKRVSLATAITHAVGAFFKSYFLKRGFLDGPAGFIISAYNAHTAFYKYLKARERQS